MSTQAQEAFIKSIKDMEPELVDIGFSLHSLDKKGFATYIQYKSKENIQALFMFGPSDWHVELSLTKNERKYELKDLFQIPLIVQWQKENSFRHDSNDRIKEEVTWFVSLLKFIIRTHLLTN